MAELRSAENAEMGENAERELVGWDYSTGVRTWENRLGRGNPSASIGINLPS